MNSSTYETGAAITFFLVFIGTWIYCIATYGFLFGVGLGWLPAAIVGALVAVLWPVIAFVGGCAAIILFFTLSK